MSDSIFKKVVKGFGEIGKETVEKGVKGGIDITQSVITGEELLGLKKIDPQEVARIEREEQQKKEEEMARLRQATMGQGRNVEEEIGKIRSEKEQKEKEKEEMFLENIKRQREVEERERQELVEMPGNAKREAAKRQFAPGKRKKQSPDASQMSQTSEFKGGKID